MFGPKRFFVHEWVSVGILLLLSTWWFIFVAPFLWQKVTPALPGFAAYFLWASWVFLWVTMVTEPGIIPRKRVFEINGAVPEKFSAENLSIDPEGPVYKYCPTCEIYRPPRAHHCKHCNNCVLLFDHHWPYINSWIGKRNYRYFISLVLNLVFLGIVDVIGLWFFLFYDTDNEDHSSRSFISDDSTILIIVIAISVFALIMTCLLCVLWFFHVSLWFTGETTTERLTKPAAGSKDEKVFWKQTKTLFDLKQTLTLE